MLQYCYKSVTSWSESKLSKLVFCLFSHWFGHAQWCMHFEARCVSVMALFEVICSSPAWPEHIVTTYEFGCLASAVQTRCPHLTAPPPLPPPSQYRQLQVSIFNKGLLPSSIRPATCWNTSCQFSSLMIASFSTVFRDFPNASFNLEINWKLTSRLPPLLQ